MKVVASIKVKIGIASSLIVVVFFPVQDFLQHAWIV